MSVSGDFPVDSSGQALPPGTRLEEFVIERVLGSGGFGITYLAGDSRLGRQVVIKENLPAQFAFRDPASLTVRPRHTQVEDAENFAWSQENFAKEAGMLASLRHEGIVPILRSFEALGTAYFVMPFVEGTALDEQIRHRQAGGNAFSEGELSGLLWRMLDALDYLHARGIYHRDIKPANILITREGVPVLIDFGSARQRLGERSLTVIESPGYTPFEQLQSRGKIGPWSDLYALGGTLYKAITGEAPPKATDRALEDEVVPLAGRAELRAGFSMRFLESIDRAMAPRIEGRFREAAEWRRVVWENSSERDFTDPKTESAPAAGSSPVRPSTGKPKAMEKKQDWEGNGDNPGSRPSSPYGMNLLVWVANGQNPESRRRVFQDQISAESRAHPNLLIWSEHLKKWEPARVPTGERRRFQKMVIPVLKWGFVGGLIGLLIILMAIIFISLVFAGMSTAVDPVPTAAATEPNPPPAIPPTTLPESVSDAATAKTAATAKDANHNPPDSFTAPGPGETSILGKTRDLIDSFLRAPDVATRLKYTYQGESLRAAVEDYHKKWPYERFDQYSLQLYQTEFDTSIGGPYWVFIVSTSDEAEGFPFIVRTENGLLKADWEIFAEFSGRQFLRFRDGKMAPPATFRLILERFTDYYGSDRDAFTDLGNYLVYQVYPPYGETEFSEFVFVKTDSELGKELDKLVGIGDEPIAVVLTLDQQAFAHGVKHYVITDLVTEGWFR